MKQNQLEIESQEEKVFITFKPGKRPHIVHKDKQRHEYTRIDHPAVHYVRSHSRPTKLHMVVEHKDGWICTCEAWQYHGECKHIHEVLENLDGSADPSSSSLILRVEK